jgi:predicted amidohydrolase YtcJ
MKNRLLPAILIIVSLMNHSCTSRREIADLIIYNAKIYTVDEQFSQAQSMAVSNGLILAVGSDRDIMKQYDAVNRFDAGRKPVYPGFIDAHSHFTGYALGLQRADLRHAKSFDEVLEIMQKHAGSHPTEWLVGRGWDQNNWPEKEFPSHQRLSELFPDVPVVLIRVDGHAVITNLEAIRRLGLDDNSQFPEGEAIYENGKLAGVFLEHSADRFKNAVSSLRRSEMIAAMQEAQEKCVKAGLTSVSDAGLDKETVLILDSLYNEDALDIRIYAMLNPTEENMEHFVKNGILKTDRLNVRSIKLFADGALGSRGARLLEPYSDASGHHGIWVHNEEMMHKYSKLAHDHGYQMIIHAIGDAATRRIIDVYSDYLQGTNDLRWRIEHAQVVHPDDFERFGQYSVIPSIQSIHATSDMRWAGSRIGPERLKNSYAQQQLLAQNGWIPNGTDFPVEEIYPLWTFHAAVFRKDHTGYPQNGFQMEEALTREQALRSMTIWAAKAAFEENEKGSLEPGKMADFILLDHDIMESTEAEILRTKVLRSWIAGKAMF